MKNPFQHIRRCRLLLAVFCLFCNIHSLHAQWVNINVVPSTSSIDALCFVAKDTNLFVGTRALGVILSMDAGASWTPVNSGLKTTSGLINTSVCALVCSGTNIFAGLDGGGVFLSTNNGSSWIAVNSGLTDTSVYALAAIGDNLFAGSYNGDIFLSTNDGKSWNQVNNGWPLISNVNVLTASGNNLFAGTWTKYLGTDGSISGGAFLSTDFGTTWTQVLGPQPVVTFGPVISVDAIAIMGTNIFAGTSNGVYLSTDDTSWTAVNSGLPTNDPPSNFAVSETNIFGGTQGNGVFLSTDNGTSWWSVSLGLPKNLYVSALAVSGANLFASGYAVNSQVVYGFWRRPLSEMIPATAVRTTESEAPKTFSLSQNYPNPFNPTTTISFALPAQSFVSLKVFDMLGREVLTIVSGELRAGSYTRQWNASNVASGVYFYRLQAETFSGTKKLLLLK